MNGIVLVNQSAGYLFSDIAVSFLESGKYDKVVILTGNDQDLHYLTNKGIIVEHIHPYKRKSFYTRTYSWVVGTLQVLIKILHKYKDYELFLVSNPPTISFITKFCSNTYSTLIYDIYPDGLIGIISENNVIVRIWKKFNHQFYNNASRVFTISQGMADRLSSYCDSSKIEIVPIWYNDSVKFIDKEKNPFIKEHNLEGKFVVMYSGNIGKAHNVSKLIEIANKLRTNLDIVFVIIGDGFEKQNIINKIEQYGLNNVLMLPYQPVEKMSYSLSAADMSYISSVGSTLCIPSKTFNLINLEIPIICVSQNETEVGKMIDNNQVGFVCNQQDIDEVCKFIIEAKTDASVLSKYKQNLAKVKQQYSPVNAKLFT